MKKLGETAPRRRWRIAPWLPLASLLGLGLGASAIELGGETWLPALVLGGAVGGYAAIAHWLAADAENKSAATTCAFLGALWACAAGFGAYWSSWKWFWKVDVFVIWLAWLVAQARISRSRIGLRLGAHAVLLLSLTWMSYGYGAVVRGFSEDPRM